MRKWVSLGGCLVLLLGVLFFIGQRQPSQRQDQAAQSPSNQRVAETLPAHTQEDPDVGASNPTKDDQSGNPLARAIRFFDDHNGSFNALAALVVAVFTGLLWWITRRQLIATELAARALVSAERAHVFVRVDAQSVQQIILNASMIDLNPEMASATLPTIRVSYVAKNFGKTPCVLKEINHDLVPMADLPGVPVYSAPRGLPYKKVLAANDETVALDCYSEKPITVETAREIVAGRCSMCFWGRIVYEDVITGSLHVEPFLYRYAGAGFNPDYREAYNRRT